MYRHHCKREQAMPSTLPPPQYDHPPEIPVVEHILSFEEVTEFCGPHAFGACMTFAIDAAGKKVCHIWISRVGDFVLKKDRRWFLTTSEWRLPRGTPGVVRPEHQEMERRHELAHCNGWPANHPTNVEQTLPPLPRPKPPVAAITPPPVPLMSGPSPPPMSEPNITVLKVRPATGIPPRDLPPPPAIKRPIGDADIVRMPPDKLPAE